MSSKRSTRAAALVLATGLLLPGLGPVPTSAQAPPLGTGSGPEVTVVLEGQLRASFRLAMPDASSEGRNLSPELEAAAREIDKTLRSDLEASRVFLVQGPRQLSVLALTGETSRDAELYRSLGNELLLEASVNSEEGRMVLEGRVYDLKSGKPVLGKRYRGTASAARRIAHTFADEMVLFFSGRPGIALTSIAFTSDRSGYKEVFLMDYDGQDQRPATSHKSISLSPVWSPSGKELAYVSYFSGAPGIYRADLGTGKKTPIFTEGSLNISPDYSPDGRRIVFAHSVGRGNTEIFVANRDGSALRQLTHSSGIDTNPAWSPNGRGIAFTSSRAGAPQIYLMDAEGANLRRITFEGDYNDGAAWSPDGTRIVYATRRGGSFSIGVSDIVTLETKVLTSNRGDHEMPTFSPNGKSIAFASKQRYGKRSETQIYVMQADGSNLRQLTTEGNNSAPSWSKSLR